MAINNINDNINVMMIANIVVIILVMKCVMIMTNNIIIV